MNKTAWIVSIVVAIVFGGGGFWIGRSLVAGPTTSTTARFAGAGGAFSVRGTGSFAGATVGTIISMGNGSITIQLPNSTSSSATTGTKLILIDDSTQVEELQSVPASNLSAGQTVIVAGSANSDGSITASSIQIRPTNPHQGAPAQ